MPTARQVFLLVRTLLVGGCGALVFNAFGLPAAYMSGALVAVAAALLRDGAAVTLMARGAAALEQTRDSLVAKNADADRIYTVCGDALEETQVQAAIEDSVERFGRLDFCVPTVGGGAIRPLLTHSAASFMQDIELNILSSFLAVRYCVPHISAVGGGAIVLVSSDAAKLAFPWLPAYCTIF